MTRYGKYIKENISEEHVEESIIMTENKRRFFDFLFEADTPPTSGAKKDDGTGIPVNDKGERDHTGTGVPPEEGWKTPEQREADAKGDAQTQKDQEEAAIEAEKEKLQKRDDLVHSKLGRLLATPEELEELDDERDEKERIDAKKEQLRSEKKQKDIDDNEKETIKESKVSQVLKKNSNKQTPITQKTIDWWNSHSPEQQQAHVKQHPDADVAQLVSQGKLKYGKKAGEGEGKTGGSDNKATKDSVGTKVIRKSPVEIKNIAKKEFEKEKETKKKEKEKEIQKELGGLKKKGSVEITSEVINGRIKTLNQNIKTSKQTVFTEKLYDPIKGDDDFYKKVKLFEKKNLSIENNWKPLAFMMNGKVPNREVQIFSRMMNTKKIGNAKPPISFFTEGKLEAGKGTSASQAGELMTMMCVTMSEVERKEFNDSVRKHLQDNPDVVVDETWLNAALNNTKAIHKKLEKDYDVDNASSIITHACWDSTDEVEALGLDDPKKNKGASTDIYVKVKTPNGVYKLHEISLKKSKKANFTNSGVTKLKTWSKEPMPKAIDPEIQGKKQLKLLSEIVKKHTTKIANILNSGSRSPIVTKLRKKLGKDNIKDFLHGSNVYARSTLATALSACAENDRECSNVIENLRKESKDYSKRVIKAIRDYPDYQKGMLNSIRKDFPIKACAENEEMMVIGNMALDRRVVNKIFGTSSWKNIKEHLTAVTEGKKHYLAYQAGEGEKLVHIANVVVREDRIIYGGTWKFELTMADKFSASLSKANKEVFGESIDYTGEFDDLLLEAEENYIEDDDFIYEEIEPKLKQFFESYTIEEDD